MLCQTKPRPIAFFCILPADLPLTPRPKDSFRPWCCIYVRVRTPPSPRHSSRLKLEPVEPVSIDPSTHLPRRGTPLPPRGTLSETSFPVCVRGADGTGSSLRRRSACVRRANGRSSARPGPTAFSVSSCGVGKLGHQSHGAKTKSEKGVNQTC